jgi:hypothetical protein
MEGSMLGFGRRRSEPAREPLPESLIVVAAKELMETSIEARRKVAVILERERIRDQRENRPRPGGST